MALLVGARIDCWHANTELPKVTDAGFKDFSAALGSSTTITTVELIGKFKWLVYSYGWFIVLLCIRCGVVCVVWVYALVGSARRVDVGAGPHQQVARVWVLGGWRSSWGL